MKLILFFIMIKNIFRQLKFLFIILTCTLIIACFLFLLSYPTEIANSHSYEKKSIHFLCVIVPFRDRFEELLQFVPHLSKFLNRQHINHYIFIINQYDLYRFNRGSLINAGFKYSTSNSNCSYIAMHDVDLLPLNDNISYAYPGNIAFHVASPNLHPRYHYQTFIGGILIMNKQIFQFINGLSNRYWGWGVEDDELYLRLKEKKIKIFRPENVSTNITNTFWHIHTAKRKRDMQRCYNQAKVNLKRDRVTGLHNVNYNVKSVYSLSVNNFTTTLVNIELHCDRNITPWCTCKNTSSLNI